MRQSSKSQTPKVQALDPEKRTRLILNIASALPQGIPIARLSDDDLLYWQKHRSELHRSIGAMLLRELKPTLIRFEIPAIDNFEGKKLFKVDLGAEVPIAEAEWFPHDTRELERLVEKDIPAVVLSESDKDGEYDTDPDLNDVLRGWTVLRPNKYPLSFAHVYHFLKEGADPTRGYVFKRFWYRGGDQNLYASYRGKGWKIKLCSNPTGPGD